MLAEVLVDYRHF